MITASIVSHGQAAMLTRLIPRLLESRHISKIVVTLNFPELLPFDHSDKLVVIVNLRQRGFAANHNSAFHRCDTQYFAILNPDLDVDPGIWAPLLEDFSSAGVGLVVPRVVDSAGAIQDSWRTFPGLLETFSRGILALFRKDGGESRVCTDPQWAAGMFFLMQSDVYRAFRGFDERYFLYYEDVDLCRRLVNCRKTIVFNGEVAVVHDAQRSSHKNVRYFVIHVFSALKYFFLRRVT